MSEPITLTERERHTADMLAVAIKKWLADSGFVDTARAEGFRDGIEKAAQVIKNERYAYDKRQTCHEAHEQARREYLTALARLLPAPELLSPAAIRALADTPAPFDFLAHLKRQRDWSERTFGPGARACGVVDHIRKELREIEANPADLTEWIDVVILALDGAWRSGAAPEQIVAALVAKQARNEARKWPDWRTMSADKAIEHDRSADAPASHKIEGG